MWRETGRCFGEHPWFTSARRPVDNVIIRRDFGCYDEILTIDYHDVRHCNWIRFIQAARELEEVNLIARVIRQRPVFQVVKPVRANEEIRVYFDAQVARMTQQKISAKVEDGGFVFDKSRFGRAIEFGRLTSYNKYYEDEDDDDIIEMSDKKVKEEEEENEGEEEEEEEEKSEDDTSDEDINVDEGCDVSDSEALVTKTDDRRDIDEPYHSDLGTKCVLTFSKLSSPILPVCFQAGAHTVPRINDCGRQSKDKSPTESAVQLSGGDKTFTSPSSGFISPSNPTLFSSGASSEVGLTSREECDKSSFEQTDPRQAMKEECEKSSFDYTASCPLMTEECEKSSYEYSTPRQLMEQETPTLNEEDDPSDDSELDKSDHSSVHSFLNGMAISEGGELIQVPRRPREKTWLPCDEPGCKKRFDRPSLLKRHMRTHTGEKPFTCDVCPKAFSTSSSLNTHRRIHTGEKPHKCRECGKCFTASSNLYYHIMTHKKEKPHKCTLCAKSFPTPGDLKSHMFVHTGSWPYKCDVCDRGFSKQANLKNHRLSHTGERPFDCDICGRTFGLQCNLKSHLKMHEDEQPERCLRCGCNYYSPYDIIDSPSIGGVCRNCNEAPKTQIIAASPMSVKSANNITDNSYHVTASSVHRDTNDSANKKDVKRKCKPIDDYLPPDSSTTTRTTKRNAFSIDSLVGSTNPKTSPTENSSIDTPTTPQRGSTEPTRKQSHVTGYPLVQTTYYPNAVLAAAAAQMMQRSQQLQLNGCVGGFGGGGGAVSPAGVLHGRPTLYDVSAGFHAWQQQPPLPPPSSSSSYTSRKY